MQALGSGGRGILAFTYIYSKIYSDFLTDYLYLYPAIRQILLSGIICIRLCGKFYYAELSVSGYPAKFTVRAYLHYMDISIVFYIQAMKSANGSLYHVHL